VQLINIAANLDKFLIQVLNKLSKSIGFPGSSDQIETQIFDLQMSLCRSISFVALQRYSQKIQALSKKLYHTSKK